MKQHIDRQGQREKGELKECAVHSLLVGGEGQVGWQCGVAVEGEWCPLCLEVQGSARRGVFDEGDEPAQKQWKTAVGSEEHGGEGGDRGACIGDGGTGVGNGREKGSGFLLQLGRHCESFWGRIGATVFVVVQVVVVEGCCCRGGLMALYLSRRASLT